MRECRVISRSLSVALFLVLAAPTCGGNGGGGSKFCNDWAAAFCRKVWACTTDPASNPFAGSSEAECKSGYAMLCSQQQPAGQTFDVNCAGKQVNEAAKTSCLDRLATVSCDDFNAPTYEDDCDLVCTAGPSTGTAGSGGGGTGGGGPSGCGVQPCGGDLIGTWTLSDVCLTPPSTVDPDCPGSSVSNPGGTESGTLTFNAGGTYTASINATLSYTETTPASCIAPSTCADLPSIYAILGAAANCTGTTTCVCSIAIAGSAVEAGTYTISGTTVTKTPAGGYPDPMGYCVQGTSVHFLSYDDNGQVTTEEIAHR